MRCIVQMITGIFTLSSFSPQKGKERARMIFSFDDTAFRNCNGGN